MSDDLKFYRVDAINGRLFELVGSSNYVIPQGLYTMRELQAHVDIAFAAQDQLFRRGGTLLTASDLAEVVKSVPSYGPPS